MAFSSGVSSLFLRTHWLAPNGLFRSNLTLSPRSVATTGLVSSTTGRASGLSSHFEKPKGVLRYIQVVPLASVYRNRFGSTWTAPDGRPCDAPWELESFLAGASLRSC